MATSSCTGPVIYSIGNDNVDPNINKAIQDSLKELLEKFKDTQNIIYVNIEKLLLESEDTHRSRSRSKSKARDASRSRSRSRSRSHSHHRRGKHHHRHHGRGPRIPPHFLHRRPHYPFHYAGHHYPAYYYSSDLEETSCDLTPGDTTEENRASEPCCRHEGRHRGRWHRRHSRSRSKSKGRKHGKGCTKKADNTQTNEAENQNIITIDEDEPKNPVSGEDLEKQFDSLNVSKVP